MTFIYINHMETVKDKVKCNWVGLPIGVFGSAWNRRGTALINNSHKISTLTGTQIDVCWLGQAGERRAIYKHLRLTDDVS